MLRADARGRRHTCRLSQLECRVMLSAAPAAVFLDAAHVVDCAVPTAACAVPDAPKAAELESGDTSEQTQVATEVVFIDSAVADSQLLLG